MEVFLFWTTQQFSVVAKPRPPPCTRWRPRKMENYKRNGLGGQFSLLLILSLFAHQFHLPQHRILVATKGNTILPLMKKRINIHLPGNVIGHELYMNMCSGEQTVRLCVKQLRPQYLKKTSLTARKGQYCHWTVDGSRRNSLSGCKMGPGEVLRCECLRCNASTLLLLLFLFF